MFCKVCKKYGKPPTSARGAWVTKPINNWVKATEFLKQHEKSDWHKTSVEVQFLSKLASTSSQSITDRLTAIREEEKKSNRNLVKMLIRSLYFF